MRRTLARCKDKQVTFGGAVVCSTFLAFYHAAQDLPDFDPTQLFKIATDLNYNMRRRAPQPLEADAVSFYVTSLIPETTKFGDLVRQAKCEIDSKVRQMMLLAAVPIILDQRINSKIQPSFAIALNIRQSQTSDANISNIGCYPLTKEHLLRPSAVFWVASMDSFCYSMGHKCHDDATKSLFTAFVKVCENIGSIEADQTLPQVLQQFKL
ncbi:hypothetical protein PHMEG_0001483 [Phytophthora megakarya]|uniref:Uncharacterized protein n=1 Tax=Phytophthora megakarya TaxID=4795 RepID=A0A225X162_9STRA|nr:hypothetical protein PHMEG_0001483 [Phytophthora megakarya]